MANVKLHIDISKLAEGFAELKIEVQQDLDKGFKQLAAATNARLKEIAQAKLGSGSRWSKFKDSLGFEQIGENVYVISIDGKGLWVEDGLPKNFDMKAGLLKSKKAKMSKDGNKYLVVPFEHSRPPRQTNDFGKTLIDKLKSELKQRRVPFKAIEKNPNGSPKLGKLHEFNIDSGGPLPGNVSDPLARVNIYQKQNKETGKVSRGIFTFRTVSSKPGLEDTWLHPGLEAEHFMEQVSEWALQHWENEVLPSILSKWR